MSTEVVTKEQLETYSKSEDYKSMLAKCKNRRTNTESKLLESYKDGTDARELTHNMHHHYLEISKTFRKVIDDIKSDCEGSKAFISELEADIENYENGIVSKVNNGYGAPYTQMQITESDLLRSQIVACKIVEELLPGMIAGIDAQDLPEGEEGAFAEE